MQGPPITIDWQSQAKISAPVEEYEERRPKRRTASEFNMPSEYRHRLLRNSGFSAQEIQKYTRTANIIRKSRRKNAFETSQMSGLSEKTERLSCGLSNLTLNVERSKKEQEFVKKSLPTVNNETFKMESTELTEDTLVDDEEEAEKLLCSA